LSRRLAEAARAQDQKGLAAMMVNAAVFTCSICGEASTNICAYCTKDACSNHRCERCKRCSDCCECEYPLSAEEVVPTEEVVAAEVAAEIESAPPESLPVSPPGIAAPFLTLEESSVFSEPFIPEEEPEQLEEELGQEPGGQWPPLGHEPGE
jgi:hypothetical protein